VAQCPSHCSTKLVYLISETDADGDAASRIQEKLATEIAATVKSKLRRLKDMPARTIFPFAGARLHRLSLLLKSVAPCHGPESLSGWPSLFVGGETEIQTRDILRRPAIPVYHRFCIVMA